MEDFYQFLERTIQALDLAIFLVSSHSLRPILNMLNPIERMNFMSIPLHALFRDIECEKPMKAILSAYLKKNFKDHKNISSYFLDNFSLFFTEADAKITEAEQCLELVLKMPDENSAEKEKYFSKGLMLLYDNISEVSGDFLDHIHSNYLEKIDKYWETIVLCVKYLNNLCLLEQEIKSTQAQIENKKHMFENKQEVYIKNIQINKESTRELIEKILVKILESIKYFSKKNFFSLPNISKSFIPIKTMKIEILNDLFEKCIKEIFKCHDDQIQKLLVGWLFNEQLFESILNIDSKIVEEVLLSENDQKFKGKYLTLYKYYLNKGNHLQASRIAVKISLFDQSETIAIDPSSSNQYMKDFIIPEVEVINITERLKFMNFAIQELENHLALLG